MHRLALILALACAQAPAATVIGVSDGDTLTVLSKGRPVKVRLANIDAPEKQQPFGARSKQSLSDLCYGRDASLESTSKDRYGRTVAVVHCGDVNANVAQVSREWHGFTANTTAMRRCLRWKPWRACRGPACGPTRRRSSPGGSAGSARRAAPIMASDPGAP
jgi:hypothetical protein